MNHLYTLMNLHKYSGYLSEYNWFSEDLGKNINITCGIICENPDINWCYDTLSTRSEDVTYTLQEFDGSSPYRDPDLTWDKFLRIGGKWSEAPVQHVNVLYNMLWYVPKHLYTRPIYVPNDNPNLTWRDVYYNANYHVSLIVDNKLNRWNASLNIQKTFRKWRYKIKMESSTQLLIDIEMFVNVPNEILLHIIEMNTCIAEGSRSPVVIYDKDDITYSLKRCSVDMREALMSIMNYRGEYDVCRKADKILEEFELRYSMLYVRSFCVGYKHRECNKIAKIVQEILPMIDKWIEEGSVSLVGCEKTYKYRLDYEQKAEKLNMKYTGYA
jgi:hypothetical protein